MTSKGVAGLQATTARGKETTLFLRVAQRVACSVCVRDSCDFSSGPRCMVYYFFSRPGPHFCYGDDCSHPSGRCTQPTGDIPVDFLLPRRALCLQIGAKHLSTLKK